MSAPSNDRRAISAPNLAVLFAWMVVLGATYVVAAKLSLRLSLVGESVTPLWPPTGIAVAALLILGMRVWPAIAVAAFIVNLPISPDATAAAAIAIGNTLAPIVAVLLLRRVGFHTRLDRTRDALALVFLGGLVAMTVSATIGTASLLGSHAIDTEQFWATWSVWWTGDAMGVLAVTPFLLSLTEWRVDTFRLTARFFEGLLLFVFLALASAVGFRSRVPMWAGVFPLLGWAAWRFRQRAAAPAALFVITLATLAAANDVGPLAGVPLLEKMIALQVFNASAAFTSFFFASVVEERTHLTDSEREAQAALYRREHRIAEILQRSLLPERLPETPDLCVAARYIPATTDVQVGGDWYDVLSLTDGRFGAVIGDVVGHGVGAAAAMGQMRMALRAYVLEGLGPAAILGRMNTLLQEFQPGAMATLVYVEIDLEAERALVSAAGHPSPLITAPGGATTFMPLDVAPPLGAAPFTAYKETQVALETGATIFLYTDGLVERRGESLDRGLERLRAAAAAAGEDVEIACDAIIERMLGTQPAGDDAALLAIRRLSLAGRSFHLRLPAIPTRLAPTRLLVRRWLRQNGIDGVAGDEVLLACGEACSNAIQHGYRSAEGWFEVETRLDGNDVVVCVRDQGRWKEPRPGEPAEGGRGLLLIEQLMDRVDIARGAQGTQVTMRRSMGIARG